MKRLAKILILLFLFFFAAPFSSSSASGADYTARELEDLFFYNGFGWGTSVKDRHNQISFPASIPLEDRYFFFDLGSLNLGDFGSYELEARAVAFVYANSKKVATVDGVTTVSVDSWAYRCGTVAIAKMKATGLYAQPQGSYVVSEYYRFPFERYEVNPHKTNPFSYGQIADFYTKLEAFGEFYGSLSGNYISTFSSLRIVSYADYDSDGGGIPDLDEWIRGTDVDDAWDDYDPVTREDDDGTTQYWCNIHKIWYEVNCPGCDATGCTCDACCSCECDCGHWTGDLCDGTEGENGCACHGHSYACIFAGCVHCCDGCNVCGEMTAAEHEAYHGACDGTDGENGCDCHQDENPDNDCTCGACCSHECSCGKWSGDECDGTDGENGCACHGQETDNDCTCGACCSHECSCGKWSGDECDGTDGENGCACHEEHDPETECVCANYCCACECECPAHKDGSPHKDHANDLIGCDGTAAEGSGCACHEEDPENPEDPETKCVCANYCCACECECPAHKDGSPHKDHANDLIGCDGTTAEGFGCPCHEEQDPEDPEANPGPPEAEIPEAERSEVFIDHDSFAAHCERLASAVKEHFHLSAFEEAFSGSHDGNLPSWELPVGNGSLALDLNALLDFKAFAILRTMLVVLVFLTTAAQVFHSLRKLL